ncbi:MAG: hypothetical protein GY941_21535 [Planctomycetes bacterium]|nr:hypothetical protein [Planctomycetota bacterium]
MATKIDMTNPNQLARCVVAESPFGNNHMVDPRVVCPADLHMSVVECEMFLLQHGYSPKAVDRKAGTNE